MNIENPFCCEHSSLPLVLNLLFVSAVGSVSVTSTKSNKVCRLGADVPVWMLSAIVKIHVIWLLYKPLSHESYGKASIRMPEERPWAAMMTSQYAASYQVVTIPPCCLIGLMAKKMGHERDSATANVSKTSATFSGFLRFH
ncbi:hypothetical protein T4A_4138 [Trichinella pseudospiralis]|uniref:Uncharacterized protein n=1 Tax=Trichinella pseudospiralis TaxID=6337 RepID=A0A0V1DT88_TRIPS|nr:hypothetical protein T4A_4138 [Trichinella pseudospiralis]